MLTDSCGNFSFVDSVSNLSSLTTNSLAVMFSKSLSVLYGNSLNLINSYIQANDVGIDFTANFSTFYWLKLLKECQSNTLILASIFLPEMVNQSVSAYIQNDTIFLHILTNGKTFSSFFSYAAFRVLYLKQHVVKSFVESQKLFNLFCRFQVYGIYSQCKVVP